ncbi:Ureidoglycolate lyase [Bachmanniomyces sp. S44760]|nr:Ureidoglycolate lyase [Bachmanniomyces sp. S44760]
MILTVEDLNHSSFSEFGFVIENPETSWRPARSNEPTAPLEANQGSALKYPDISPVTNLYGLAPHQKIAKPILTLFVCFPRHLRYAENESAALLRNKNLAVEGLFDLTILERHPYTTQTFIPLGLARESETAYLVVVAPQCSREGKDNTLPDLDNIRAFIARGSQAVTYGAGVWHAPMIAIGKGHVDFAVLQHSNGVPDDDCQEIEVKPSDGTVIRIAVPRLRQDVRAKL